MNSDIEASWREERQSAWLYRVLMDSEPDPRRRFLFGALAAAAEDQAEHWARKIEATGAQLPDLAPSLRMRVAAWLVRCLGARRLRPMLAALKLRGLSTYDTWPVPTGHPLPSSVEQVGLRHRGFGGGNLRAAVFGVNDGLVSNTSLIMGVAGASGEVGVVLMSGLAGWLAGALSMAAGEYVSVRSQRELFEYQIGLERRELAEYPEAEAEELALIYNARGLNMEEARALARRLIRDPEQALEVLAREELGLNPDNLGSPFGAATFSFFAFTGGALVPLLPFLAGLGREEGVLVAAGLAGAGLFAVGAAMSLFTGRSALAGALRMVLIGGGAGVATHLLGTLLGAAAH